MKKFLLACAAFLMLTITACNDASPQTKQVTKAPVCKPVARPVAKPHDTISIAAVGDIMLGTSYPSQYTLPPDSAKNSFKTVLNELRNADLTFGNLEGTLLDKGTPARYKKNLAVAYFFKMPTTYVGVLKDAGFDVVSLANNHSGDFGEEGRESTTKTLDSAGINYGGLLSHPTTVFKLKGITYGFCAFAPNANTLPILDLKNEAQIISDLKKQADIVIVSFHGGAEGAAYEHVPLKGESFMGQKRGDVRAFAHTAIDAGADVVLGNGPHVNRGMERYKNRLIAYSLGNFCTYKSVSVDGVCGLSSLLKVNLNKKGEFLNGQIIALKQTHLNGLQRDSLNKVVARMQALTKADFTEPGLAIADDGKITGQ
ncbi:CapA family protein [Mucilaginibacter sp. AW1-3]